MTGPTGKAWGSSTINGNRQRGTGILNNEMYIGRLVWNRIRYVKDPETGKRISRPNREYAWVIQEVPDLRIVEHELWDKVKDVTREALGLSEISCVGHDDAIGGDIAWHDGRSQLSQTISWTSCWLVEIPNELYVGRLVWNRLRYIKDPDTGKRVSRPNPKSDWIVQDVPDLRIIDDALWEQVKERQAAIHPNVAEIYRTKIQRLEDALARPDDAREAAEAMRSLIEKIVLTPRRQAWRGQSRTPRRAGGHPGADLGAKAQASPGRRRNAVSVGVGFEPTTFRL